MYNWNVDISNASIVLQRRCLLNKNSISEMRLSYNFPQILIPARANCTSDKISQKGEKFKMTGTTEHKEIPTSAKVVGLLLVTAVFVGVAVATGLGDSLIFFAIAAITVVILFAGFKTKDGLTRWMAAGWVVVILVFAAFYFVPADAFEPKPEKEVAAEQSNAEQTTTSQDEVDSQEATSLDTTKIVTAETDLITQALSSPKALLGLLVVLFVGAVIGWFARGAVSK